ncbi:MAG: c-type cytochrome [Deltaproteobacteria bacterium]|nr:c-type cytochrome [Deltaproteobacteria bacterium]
MTRNGMVLLAALIATTAGCGDSNEGAEAPTPVASEAAAVAESTPEAKPTPPPHAALFGVLPEVAEAEHNPITDAKVDLGRMLYYEPRLSKNHDISCNSCHQLDNFGVDSEPTSPGHKGQLGGRNSPTVLNAALHVAQFWDGREPHVEAQAKGPVLNPVEMAMSGPDAVVATLKSIPGYVDGFAKAFPGEDPVTYDNMAAAIGAFERKLLTPSPFDAYLGGDVAALNDAQRAGLETFVATGCTACHSGVAVGGAMYQKLGLVEAWPNITDKGRSEVTGNAAEEYFFKVPSLRNIAKTGPYFHDGKTAELTVAVKMMAKHQLGKELADDEVASIVSFLDSLTGTVDAKYAAKPELPPSSDTTPKPDPT